MLYMVGKLGMWGILWCLAKIFWRYYLRYRILLSLWDWYHQYSSHLVIWPKALPLLFRAAFKWRLQENRFFLVFGLIIHFMATTTKAKRCIFISRTPKCPGADEAGGAGRRYRLFSASLRSQFGPIWIVWGHGWWKLCSALPPYLAL